MKQSLKFTIYGLNLKRFIWFYGANMNSVYIKKNIYKNLVESNLPNRRYHLDQYRTGLFVN